MIRGARHCKQSLKGALHFNLNPPFSLSIHCPSTCLLKSGHSGSKLKFPVPPEGSQVVPGPDKIWVYPPISSQLHMRWKHPKETSLPEPQTASSSSFQQVVVVVLLWDPSGCLNSLPLKLAPATPRKKLISATCIHKFSLLLIIRNSWP